MQETSFKIYNASAGSGKTYTLAKEYLSILLSTNDGFRRILAITFTNKAVNEMKDRILNSLFEFSQPHSLEQPSPMFTALLNELNLTPLELNQKSKYTLKKILHNYAFFDVSTIDKFTHRLIRTFAKDLKLPQNFEVVLDTSLLLDEAVARLINKAGTDPQITKVLIDFALEKIDDDKSWDIALDLNKVGKLLFDENNAKHLQQFADKNIDDFLELQKKIKQKIEILRSEILKNSSQILAIIDENGLEFSDFKSSYFPKFILKIHQGDFNINFNAGWKQNFDSAPLYAGKCEADKKSILDVLQPQFVVHFNAIKQSTYEFQFLNNVYKNIVPLTVLNAIQQEIKGIENERDQLPIYEFNRIIAKEIKNQPAPFIYERLGEKYSHYFIDEFQDTSEMQWQNLIPLVDNALSAEKGSLFIVGDAKQAIYRWRGGKAEQFLDLVNAKANPFVIAATIENLPGNYRSLTEIVAFNNDFFTSTSTKFNSHEYQNLFETGNNQISNAEKGGLVQLSFIEENDDLNLDERYGAATLQTINEVIANHYDYKDICILVRGNKEGVALANYLVQEKIPIISSESLLLQSSSKILFLINLLRYQNQPDDEVSFELLSFLSINKEHRHQFIAAHLKNPTIVLETEFSFSMNRLMQLSVYDGMEYAIKQFDLAPSPDAYINFFMDTILDVEQKEGVGIPIYLSYWEKKKDKLSITAPATVNAVQIMTVHKAKGLEFDITIFPYAHTKIYNEQDPKLWLPVNTEIFDGFSEVLINKKQEVSDYNTLASHLVEEENNRLELDAFNVLYVALTRAAKASYIITGPPKASKDSPKNYTDLFISYLNNKGMWSEHSSTYTFGSLPQRLKSPSDVLLEDIPFQYSYKDRPAFNILTSSGMLWDTDREEAITQGNLVHHIMSLIKTKEDVLPALGSLIQSGVLSIQDKDEVHERIQMIITHPKLAPYYKEGNLVKNEKDIITKNGSILRPDRVVISNNHATIIDYKTGKPNTRYHEQIQSYADALFDIGYQIENKIIIYINEEVIPEFI